MSKQSTTLIRGTLILTLAGIFAKIISAFYKVPLERFTGTVGLGYYQNIYGLYSLLTAASLIGIPNSISKLVAEEIAKNNYRKAHDIFRYALIITGSIGLLISGVLIFLGDGIRQVMDWDDGSQYALLGMGIAPFFISIAGAIRGYLQGMQQMAPTAISQIIENTVKVIIGISLVYILLEQGYDIPVAIGGAALGVSLGFVFSAFFLLMAYLKQHKEIMLKVGTQSSDEHFSKVFKKIAMIAVPITVASAALSIMLAIDAATLPKLLNTQVFMEGEWLSEGTYINGIIGKIQTIINVPLVLSVSLIISIVPTISATNARETKDALKKKIIEGIEIAVKLALPATFGIAILAKPILNFVYQEPEGYRYLQIMAVGLVFMILGQSMTGILQGLSKYYTALNIVLVSALVKLILNVFFIQTEMNGYGVTLATVIYYMLITILSYYNIKKCVDIKTNIFHTYGKPLIASSIMGIFTYLGYLGIHFLLHSNAAALLMSVCIGIIVYLVAMIMLKAFSEEELLLIPRGNKLVEWFAKDKKI
ncbi:polysaccharide biosynthesis protein [Vallitaleaceae bacterium 9-2]